MIRAFRRNMKLTQKELASKVGITQSYLSKLENNRHTVKKNVTIGIILKLSRQLNQCPVLIAIYFLYSNIDCNRYCHKQHEKQ